MDTNPRRKRVRAPGWNYGWQGWYAVTIRKVRDAPRLSRIVDERAVLTEAGEIIAQVLRELPQRFRRLVVLESMIMPDHVHLVFELLPKYGVEDRTTLTSVVGALKSLSAIAINKRHGRAGQPFWQRSFHDRILRSEQELDAACAYIRANPRRWASKYGHLETEQGGMDIIDADHIDAGTIETGSIGNGSIGTACGNTDHGTADTADNADNAATADAADAAANADTADAAANADTADNAANADTADAAANADTADNAANADTADAAANADAADTADGAGARDSQTP